MTYIATIESVPGGNEFDRVEAGTLTGVKRKATERFSRYTAGGSTEHIYEVIDGERKPVAWRGTGERRWTAGAPGK